MHEPLPSAPAPRVKRVSRRVLLGAGAAVVAGAVAPWLRRTFFHRAPEAVELLERWRSSNPVPVVASPRGDRVLFKIFHDQEFELRVVDVRSERLIASQRARESQLAIGFRPDGEAVAYLARREGAEFHPHVHEFSAAGPRVLDAPATISAAQTMCWSPDGSRLAYVSMQTAVIVSMADGGDRIERTISNVSSRAELCWSPDGGRIAVVPRASPGSLIFARFDGGEDQRIVAGERVEIEQLSWSPDGGRLAISVRDPSAEYRRLVELELASGTSRVIAAPEGDAGDPQYLRDRSIAYTVARAGESALFVAGPATDRPADRPTDRPTDRPSDRPAVRPLAVGSRGGTTIVRGRSADASTIFVLHTPRDEPPSLYAARAAEPSKLLARGGSAEARGGASGELIMRGHLPICVWRTRGRAHGAVVLVHGGPALVQDLAWNASLQLAVAEGYHVVAPNYRGSSGFGISFERAGEGDPTPGRIADVLASIELARAELGVEPSRIALWGESYGALLSALALAEHPACCAGAVLTSIIRTSRSPAKTPQAIPKVVAFHGGRDRFQSPEAAKQTLATLFGEDVARALRVFPGEGHAFHTPRARAEVLAAVLAMCTGRASIA